MSAVDPENRFVVYPLFKGELQSFFWFNDPLRTEGLIGEIAIPKFSNSTAIEKFKGTVPGKLLDIRDGKIGDLSTVEKVSMARWIESVFKELDKVFGKEGE